MTRRGFLAAATAGSALLRAGQSAPDDLRVCPKSNPPARRLAAFRLDELTSETSDMRLTLHCLQGLVNRDTPRLFLVQDHYDELWLDWLRERGDVDEVEWLELGQLFERFRRHARCMFITDPAIPASVNVATMLAGVHDGLVATPSNAYQFDLPAGAYPDSSKVGLDLRTMHWKRDVDAYRWAYDRLRSALSKQAIAMLDPATAGIRDYLVEFRIPILWICAPGDMQSNAQASFEEEHAFAKSVLMQWPPNIPCLGWPGNGVGRESGIGEWEGVRLASECGKFEVCSAYDGYSPTVTNLSVHSGTTAAFRQKAAPPVHFDREKAYIAFTRSDGDGWNFQRHYYRKLFNDRAHGTVPLGWQIGPTATDGIPDILDFYYKHAAPGDYFFNALSGVGYIHEDNYADNYPAEQRETIWQDFLRLSAVYRGRIDSVALATFAEMVPSRMERLAGIAGIEGVFANYGRTHLTTQENLLTVSGGKPVFRSMNRGPGGNTPFTPSSRSDAVQFMIGEVRRWTPAQGPALLHVFLANWLTDMQMVRDIANGLGSRYAFVRPDQLIALWRQSR
jgi:hypothetical protein